MTGKSKMSHFLVIYRWISAVSEQGQMEQICLAGDDRKRGRERERCRQTETLRDRQTDRDKNKQRETERKTAAHTERETYGREREREKCAGLSPSAAFSALMIDKTIIHVDWTFGGTMKLWRNTFKSDHQFPPPPPPPPPRPLHKPG